MAKIHKLLIANRGEIACRIIKTCQKLGITSVAVYSEPDANSNFVKFADEAVFIGGTSPASSYLNADKIIEAAILTGANAIHPGYGFLSENANFAIKCQENGIIFIGPRPDVIDSMGDKMNAKRLMVEKGVPVVPGYRGDNQDVSFLNEEANKIGYPLIIKALAGGGGKGMRVVNSNEEFKSALEGAQREALSAFGDNRVLLEKYFPSAKHIEVQILGDNHHNIVHLFERDCTVQRRYQKVIEESPTLALNPEQRANICKTAVLAASALNYNNAGTVEFIADPEGNFYFLEVNTRLQVEHPVTEMVTGLDLVELQIRIAENEVLPFQQAEIQCKGHAIECRIYAEDPHNQFLPSAGLISLFEKPNSSDARWETDLSSNAEISIFYDPMIAKVITFASDRNTAILKMSRTLELLGLLGIPTNQDLLIQILNHPDFQSINFDTHFIQNNLEKLIPTQIADDYSVLAALFSIHLNRKKEITNLPTGWRNQFFAPQKENFQFKDQKITATYSTNNSSNYDCTVDSNSYQVKVIQFSENIITLEINNLRLSFYHSCTENQINIQRKGKVLKLTHLDRLPLPQKENSDSQYIAPMPSEVIKVNVKEGDEVKSGDILLILSSMKMENAILAQKDGKIKAVYVADKSFVEAKTILLEFE